MTDTYSITYAARGATYNLNGYDADHGLTLRYLGDQGFGLAPLHRITTRGPLQHGDSDIDFRLDPRILQIPLVVQNTSTSPINQSYVIRKALLNIFRPQDSGTLRVQTSTIDRSIDVRVLGGLTFDVDPQDYHVRTVVQLRADDPTWYDNQQVNEFIFTQSMFNINYSVSNAGNWQSFPQILITGPVTDVQVINETQGQELRFNGTIPAGTTYYIDLRYGYKTVYTGPNQTGTNVIDKMNPSSNLATFAIRDGNNSLVVYGGTTSSATRIALSWSNRYTGI